MATVIAPGSIRSASATMQRQSNWFLPWAAFGFAWCVLIVYMAIGWFTSDEFYRVVPTGPDIPPVWMVISARVIEIISVSCSIFVVYKYLIKPWRLTGEMSGDGILMLACATMYVQDFWCNYFGYFCQLSSVFISWGSWANFVPGWVSPNHGRLPEAPVAWGMCYGSWFVLLPMIYGGKAMGWLRSKYPRMSSLQMFGVAFIAFTIAWFCVEATFLRTGMYAYGVAIEPLTLWYGEYYQYPIYEFVAWGLCYAIFASLYYYRDDKGLTYVEKGIDKLQVSGPKKKALRFFALTGFMNIVFLFLWSFPMSLTTLWAGPLSKEMPSFLVNDLCGPNTNYDCPAPEVPLARRSSLTNRTVSADQLPVSAEQQALKNRVDQFAN